MSIYTETARFDTGRALRNRISDITFPNAGRAKLCRSCRP
ncbi:hypothetical protein ACVMB2_003905 [Sinorhizobium meliloti]